VRISGILVWSLQRLSWGKAPLAVKMAKRAINEGVKVSLEEGLELEEKYFGGALGIRRHERRNVRFS